MFDCSTIARTRSRAPSSAENKDPAGLPIGLAEFERNTGFEFASARTGTRTRPGSKYSGRARNHLFHVDAALAVFALSPSTRTQHRAARRCYVPGCSGFLPPRAQSPCPSISCWSMTCRGLSRDLGQAWQIILGNRKERSTLLGTVVAPHPSCASRRYLLSSWPQRALADKGSLTAQGIKVPRPRRLRLTPDRRPTREPLRLPTRPWLGCPRSTLARPMRGTSFS